MTDANGFPGLEERILARGPTELARLLAAYRCGAIERDASGVAVMRDVAAVAEIARSRPRLAALRPTMDAEWQRYAGRSKEGPKSSSATTNGRSWHLGPKGTATKPKREREEVELRDRAAPCTTVKLSSAAWRTISYELFDARELLREGVEWGGFLFAESPFAWRREGIAVSLATGPGPKSEHGRGKMRIDFDECDVLEHQLVRVFENRDLWCVGSWHTHPAGDGRPSDDDLAHWLSIRDYNDKRRGRIAPFALGLILTPRAGEWHDTGRYAWVIRREQYGGRAVCEPASVAAVGGA